MFAYCLNNPVRYVDVTGYLAQSAIDLDGDNNDIFDPDAGGNGGAGSSGHLGTTGGTVATSNKSSIKDLLKSVACFFDQLFKNVADAVGGLTGVIRTQPNTDVCFVAGTLVHTEDGAVPIENIKENDYVWARDEETGTVALKKVVETYINQTDKLIHLFVGGEEIITTPEHPFYAPVKGWTKAAHLRAGDILVLVNGEHVIVEKVQHEIIDTPVMVYNFHVEDFHTYYVTSIGVLVHNTCSNLNTTTKWDLQYNSKGQVKVGKATAQYDGKYYWLKDTAEHGGSYYKVYERHNKYLYWFRDADMYGNFIYGKHKSDIGTKVYIGG